jgi:hypothetical protein
MRVFGLGTLSVLVALPALAVQTGCGGAAAPRQEAATQVPQSDPSDPDFAAYAATHGIATLNGGGGEVQEVTADGLRLELLEKDKPVKLDGVLNEWPAPAKADVVIKGSAAKTGLKISLQYDDTKLYVGADVTDPSFVAGQDHVSLLFAVPQPGGGYTTYDVALYAGKPGESEGSVRYGRRNAIPGAKIVEAPTSGGYSIEATVPLAALPELRTTRVGVHGAARYFDGENLVATGPGDAQHPAAMPWVPSEPELSMVEQLLTPRGLTKTAPTVDVVADLTGDGIRERVAVFGQNLTICGTGFMGGTGFFFRDLGGDLVKLDVRDVTGRGKQDVIVRRRVTTGESQREFVEVLGLVGGGEEPKVTFGHEIAVRQGDKHIDNALRMARGEIEVSVEPPVGWDPLSYREPIVSDIEPILFPWGGVRSQMWRWDGSHFTKGKEVTQKEQMPTAAGTPEQPAPVHPPEPPTPKVSKGGDMGARILEQYRKDRGVAADLTPKADLKVHVAGDKRPERVVLVGKDVVVFGPGFRGGNAYAYVTLSQFAEAADITDMSARDLTGDGAADIVVRGVRHPTGEGGPVSSEMMFVYQVGSDSIDRIFGIETGREQGAKRIQGLVQFIPAPGGKTFDVLVAPGRATGWTEKTYPWAQDTPGSGSVEPLLLPWGGVSSLRYRWNGKGFAKVD